MYIIINIIITRLARDVAERVQQGKLVVLIEGEGRSSSPMVISDLAIFIVFVVVIIIVFKSSPSMVVYHCHNMTITFDETQIRQILLVSYSTSPTRWLPLL